MVMGLIELMGLMLGSVAAGIGGPAGAGDGVRGADGGFAGGIVGI